MGRLGSWSLVLATFLGAVACGKTAGNQQPSSAAGSSGEAGAAGANSEAGGPSSADLDIHTTLARSTCGITDRILLPGVPSDPSVRITSQDGGYVVGPWMNEDGWHAVVVAGNAVTRWNLTSPPLPAPPQWSVVFANIDSLQGLTTSSLVGVSVGSSSESDPFMTTAAAYGQPAGAAQVLMNAPWRGTDVVKIVPSLNGDRGVFAIWPTALAEPRILPFGPDGAPLDQPFSLTEPSHHFSSCESLVPTARGAIVSFRDTDAGTWRITESVSRGPGIDVTRPMAIDDECPLVGNAPEGAQVLTHAAGAANGAYKLELFESGGGRSETTLMFEDRPVAISSIGGLALLALYRKSGKSWVTLKSETTSADFEIADTQTYDVIPGGGLGTLYLDVAANGDDPRQIWVVTCD